MKSKMCRGDQGRVVPAMRAEDLECRQRTPKSRKRILSWNFPPCFNSVTFFFCAVDLWVQLSGCRVARSTAAFPKTLVLAFFCGSDREDWAFFLIPLTIRALGSKRRRVTGCICHTDPLRRGTPILQTRTLAQRGWTAPFALILVSDKLGIETAMEFTSVGNAPGHLWICGKPCLCPEVNES